MGSKVTASLFRSSLTMFLSVFRIRLIYSPFYSFLRALGLGPLEAWIYRKLRAPKPRSVRDDESPKSKVQSPKPTDEPPSKPPR